MRFFRNFPIPARIRDNFRRRKPLLLDFSQDVATVAQGAKLILFVIQAMGCCKSSSVKEKGIEPADIALEVAVVPEVSLAKSPQRLGCTAGRGVDRLHFESMLLPKRLTPTQKV